MAMLVSSNCQPRHAEHNPPRHTFKTQDTKQATMTNHQIAHPSMNFNQCAQQTNVRAKQRSLPHGQACGGDDDAGSMHFHELNKSKENVAECKELDQ